MLNPVDRDLTAGGQVRDAVIPLVSAYEFIASVFGGLALLANDLLFIHFQI